MDDVLRRILLENQEIIVDPEHACIGELDFFLRTDNRFRTGLFDERVHKRGLPQLTGRQCNRLVAETVIRELVRFHQSSLQLKHRRVFVDYRAVPAQVDKVKVPGIFLPVKELYQVLFLPELDKSYVEAFHVRQC